MAINVDTIKKCAEECKTILAKVETVENAINLRHIGISERAISAIDVGDGFTDVFDLHELDPNTKIQAIMLSAYENDETAILNPCWAPVYAHNPFYFDVYDPDAEAIILEEQYIETLEECYQDLCEQLTEALKLVASLTPKCVDLKQSNYFARIRDTYEIAATAEYIEDNYKVTRNEAFEYAEEVRQRMSETHEDIELESKMIKEVLVGVEKIVRL